MVIQLRVGASDYDRLWHIAHERGESVPVVVRLGVGRLLRHEPPDDGDDEE